MENREIEKLFDKMDLSALEKCIRIDVTIEKLKESNLAEEYKDICISALCDSYNENQKTFLMRYQQILSANTDMSTVIGIKDIMDISRFIQYIFDNNEEVLKEKEKIKNKPSGQMRIENVTIKERYPDKSLFVDVVCDILLTCEPTFYFGEKTDRYQYFEVVLNNDAVDRRLAHLDFCPDEFVNFAASKDSKEPNYIIRFGNNVFDSCKITSIDETKETTTVRFAAELESWKPADRKDTHRIPKAIRATINLPGKDE